jgi:hypothetical protein
MEATHIDVSSPRLVAAAEFPPYPTEQAAWSRGPEGTLTAGCKGRQPLSMPPWMATSALLVLGYSGSACEFLGKSIQGGKGTGASLWQNLKVLYALYLVKPLGALW